MKASLKPIATGPLFTASLYFRRIGIRYAFPSFLTRRKLLPEFPTEGSFFRHLLTSESVTNLLRES